MTIYVVLCEAGEYEDSRTWIVKGFFDDISARKYAQKCVIAAEGYNLKLELLESKYLRWRLDFGFTCDEETEFDTINEYDPYFNPNCEHEYRVEPLEVEGKAAFGAICWGSRLDLDRDLKSPGMGTVSINNNQNTGLSFDPQ